MTGDVVVDIPCGAITVAPDEVLVLTFVANPSDDDDWALQTEGLVAELERIGLKDRVLLILAPEPIEMAAVAKGAR